MGNYRFKFSDMLPNAWFYKLRDSYNKPRNNLLIKPAKKITSAANSNAGLPKTTTTTNMQSDQRKSYHFTRDLSIHDPNSPTKTPTLINIPDKVSDPPRKSSTTRRRRRSTKKNCRPKSPNSPLHQTSSSDHDSVVTSDTNDIILDMADNLDRLPPIITKKHEPTEISEITKTTNTSPVRRFPVKLRTTSPRIASRRVQSGGRSKSEAKRSVSGRESSFVVVKSSKDPGRDFRESMVEMIVENNLKASKDLEELLACYLRLNSVEYHDLIINVFKQIWFDYLHVRHNVTAPAINK